MSKPNSITGRVTSTGRIRGTTTPLDAGARALRKRQTPTEMLLWQHLRGHKLGGFGFRRQHPIGPFVVDFACPSRLLIVELDGPIHDLYKDQDAERNRILSEYGWLVLRFRNQEVITNLPDVLDRISLEAKTRIVVYGRETNGAAEDK